MVLKLLSLGRLGPEQRPAREDEVLASFVDGAVDEEVFLLRPDLRDDAMRKYSCSAPTCAMTRCAVVLPNSRKMRSASRLSASMLFRSGVFLSSTSPLYEKNAVGM